MTREARNIKLKHLITCMKCEVSGKVCDENCPTQYEAGNMGEIIKNLEVISEILKQQPCDDAVSRQAVHDLIAELLSDYLHDEDREKIEKLDVKIEDLEPITPKEKTGHWIIKDGKEQGYDIGGIKTWYIQIMCDKCGFIKTAIEGHTGQYHFCPNCGARMVSE